MKISNTEISRRIAEHLKRFAADPAIAHNDKGLTRYWNAGSSASGRWVYVRYIAYQGSSNLSRDEAMRYLEWLDAGNVGRHYAALRPSHHGVISE